MDLTEEIQFLKSLDSEYTVQIKNFSWHDKRLCVVTDYATGKWIRPDFSCGFDFEISCFQVVTSSSGSR